MKRHVPAYFGMVLALLFLLAFPAWADKDDSYSVNSEIGDSNVDGREHWTQDTSVDSNRGEHFEEHSSIDTWPDGSSHTHEDLSSNGEEDSDNHWSDDGSKSRIVTDEDTSSDGSRREHTVETHTDKDGNTETWDTYKTYDSKGKLTFQHQDHKTTAGGKGRSVKA